MILLSSYEGKQCKNCKFLIKRKKLFSNKSIYECGVQISGNLTNIESFYCCLYTPKGG